MDYNSLMSRYEEMSDAERMVVRGQWTMNCFNLEGCSLKTTRAVLAAVSFLLNGLEHGAITLDHCYGFKQILCDRVSELEVDALKAELSKRARRPPMSGRREDGNEA